MTDQLAEGEGERRAQASVLEQSVAQRIDRLLEDIALLRRKRFGPSAERIPET